MRTRKRLPRVSSLECGVRRAVRVVAIAAITATPTSAQYTMDWFTIDGGGAMRTTGGAFTLGGTIGQPDAGFMSGPGYDLAGGFWMASGALAVGVGEEDGGVSTDAPPLAFRLRPAEPNPLVHRSVVTFDLPQARSVSARVVDVTGRVTRTLVEGALPAGRHRTTWDGTNDTGRRVTAGMYFVVLEAGIDRARQKILVLR